MFFRFQFLKLFFKPPPLQSRPVTKQSSFTPPLASLLRRRLTNSPKNVDEPPPPTKLSLFQKFKIMYRDYWYVLVPVHVVTSCGWIGGFYYLTKSGVDLGCYMKKLGFSESLVNKANSGVGHFAIAYALYKVATPARYAVTLGGTTLAINQLRNMGYIKPARGIFNQTKEKLQNFAKSKTQKK